MECFYINLRSQTERRQFLEANFAAHQRPGWHLNRVEAIDSAEIARKGIKGRLRDAEKGCFLSHRRAIEQSLLYDGPCMILEDDAMFGPESCASIEAAVDSLPADGWDLLYSDAIIFHPPLMTGLLHMRRELAREGRHQVVNLNDITFSGATAYAVNPRSKERVLEVLDGVGDLDPPYDQHLRHVMLGGKLRGFITFPFATSISPLADSSQIQGTDTADLVWNAFRRFIWLHADVTAAAGSLDALGAEFVDPETRAFARIVSAALSTNLVLK